MDKEIMKNASNIVKQNMDTVAKNLPTLENWTGRDSAWNFVGGLRQVQALRKNLIEQLDGNDLKQAYLTAMGLNKSLDHYWDEVAQYCSGPEKYITDYAMAHAITDVLGPLDSNQQDEKTVLKALMWQMPKEEYEKIKAGSGDLARRWRQYWGRR